MRAAQATLIDMFELQPSSTQYVHAPARTPRQSIDLEVDWEEVRQASEEVRSTSPDQSTVRRIPTSEHDWQSSSSESSPGVSYESWHRARGWCAE